jgi:hypothetical protein
MMLWLVGAALAQDADSGSGSGSGSGDSRDDEIFGSVSPPPPPSVPPAPDETEKAPDTPLDQEIRSDATIGDQLAARDMRLTLGGMLYLREDAHIPDDAEDTEDVDLQAPSLLDLFADVRPNDRMRGYAQGRLAYDWTVQPGQIDPLTGEEAPRASVLLDQLWIKGDIARKVFLTVGKQRIKWGAGRFWNPTDFLNPQRLDALAVFDERTGVALVKAHVPLGTWNAYAIADLEQADPLAEVGGAARLEALVGNTEITGSVAARKNQPLRVGADLSTGVWLIDFHVEGALLHGDDLHAWGDSYNLATCLATKALGAPPADCPGEIDRSDDWVPQVTAGAEITFKIGDQDTLTWGVEGFYNDLGTDDPDLYPWLVYKGDFVPFYLGREYGGTYLYLPAPGNWQHVSFTGSVLSNLSDETGVARLDASWVVLTELSLNVYAQYHFGDQGEFAFTLDAPGFEYETATVDAGVGARIDF